MLTCVCGWLTLQRECLEALFIHFQIQVREILLYFPCHLSIFIELFSIKKGAATDPLFMPPCLCNIQHGCIGTALAERAGVKRSRRGKKESKGMTQSNMVSLNEHETCNRLHECQSTVKAYMPHSSKSNSCNRQKDEGQEIFFLGYRHYFNGTDILTYFAHTKQ